MSKKNPFKNLNPDFVADVESKNEAELRHKLSEMALDHQALLEAKELDMDLRTARETAAEAGRMYSEAQKEHTTRVKYIKSVLESRGKI